MNQVIKQDFNIQLMELLADDDDEEVCLIDGMPLDNECIELEKMHKELKLFSENDVKLINDEKEYQINGPENLVEIILEKGKKGSQISRYKGLGEMNPDQLWETTLDPNSRHLLQVKVEHENNAEDTFETLMGEVVENRRNFIQENALNVLNLDI